MAQRRILALLVIGTLLIAPGATYRVARAGRPFNEYEVKAAFLLNFTQFIEWPPEAFRSDDAPFVIGVLGDDPFGNVLEQTIEGSSVQKHKLTVKRSRQVADLKDCQLVFIPRSEREQVAQALTALDRLPVLTVGESDGFARRGGMINFLIETRDGAKVRFEINRRVAEQCRLKINSQLLRLGRIVNSDEGK